MASKKKAAAAPSLNIALLAAVVAATQQNSFVYVSDADAAPFLSHDPALMEVNPQMKDAEGKTATRATPDGVSFAAANKQPGAMASAPAAASGDGKPSFNIVMAAVPEIKRGGGRGAAQSKYPFDDMPAPVNGQSPSFFVQATAEDPEPAKSLASTVSSATRRYAEPVYDASGAPVMETVKLPKRKAKGTPGTADYVPEQAAREEQRQKTIQKRKFVIRAVEDGAVWGFPGQKGAAIYRTI